VAAVPLLAAAWATAPNGRRGDGRPRIEARYREIEASFDARVGVYAIDTATGRAVAYRSDERFAFCSTHKALSSAVLLRTAQLDRVLKYGPDDLVDYSPITEQHVDTGMTVLEVCDAALRYSDNTAANLIFRELGGPRGLTRELRRLGDLTTRSDRSETALNSAVPGEVFDTTTPRAIAMDLGRFVIGKALPCDRRRILRNLMLRNTTGAGQIRAGVPSTWRVADKTGSGGYGTANDIGVLWPPHRKPIVIAVMSTRSGPDDIADKTVIARATAVAVDALR
jgi:beta-lactamase class A